MSKTQRVAILTFLLLPSLAANADEVDELVSGHLEKKGLPGLSIAVVRDGSVVKEAAYGLANVELNCPATVGTVYEIGSITKTFTATLVMMLVEEGALGLDDPIADHLNDLPDAWKGVTIRHLLTHTSGIKNYTGATDFMALAREDHAPREILDLVADAPLEFEPGSQYRYCNTGYFLLGLIVEKATGEPFAQFLQDRILTPLGMSTTRPSNPKLIVPGRASGYGTVLGLVRVNRDPITPSSAFSAGFLISTVGDLARWDAALRAGKLLKPESFEQMYAPARLTDGSLHEYGFGWATNRRFGHRSLSHGGGTAGFSSILSRYPDDGLTIIMLCNQAESDLGALERTLAVHYLPKLDVALAEPIEDPHPETTEQLRTVLAKLLADDINRDAFTTRLADHLASEASRKATRSVAASGPIGSFVLIDLESKDEGETRRYRATLGKDDYLFTVHLGHEGEIAGLWYEKAR